MTRWSFLNVTHVCVFEDSLQYAFAVLCTHKWNLNWMIAWWYCFDETKLWNYKYSSRKKQTDRQKRWNLWDNSKNILKVSEKGNTNPEKLEKERDCRWEKARWRGWWDGSLSSFIWWAGRRWREDQSLLQRTWSCY